jgi:hypothetical protein
VTLQDRDLDAHCIEAFDVAALPPTEFGSQRTVIRDVRVELERIRLEVAFVGRLVDGTPADHTAARTLAGIHRRLDRLIETITGSSFTGRVPGC